MSIANCLSRRPWLLIGFLIGLTGNVQAGTMGDTGSGSGTSQERSGRSGGSMGSSGSSMGTTGSGSSQGMGKIQPFQTMDQNKDNYVTKSELMDSPALLNHFDRSDANKDGQLDENEYKNLMMENQK